MAVAVHSIDPSVMVMKIRARAIANTFTGLDWPRDWPRIGRETGRGPRLERHYEQLSPPKWCGNPAPLNCCCKAKEAFVQLEDTNALFASVFDHS